MAQNGTKKRAVSRRPLTTRKSDHRPMDFLSDCAEVACCMMDRSAQMATIRSKDTRPEMLVRRLAHRLGYRFRLHRKGLPGSPDLVFPSRQKAIFVHGCFWHRHDCSWGRKAPSVRLDYWLPKLERNRTRDRANLDALKRLGWSVLVLWECELSRLPEQDLADRLRSFLDRSRKLLP
jgi:DNA mismatch endonuclease, patch repair protein